VIEEEVLEWSSDSDDSDVRKPGEGMKVIMPKERKTFVKRQVKPDPGPFPHELCCRQLEQNELFCLPSASQKMITSDKAKAACVLLLCSHRATSPTGQYKAFRLRKALEAQKCCQLIVRDCTDESVLSRLLDEFIDSLDMRYDQKLAAARSEVASERPARLGLSRASSRFSMFSRQSSVTAFSRQSSVAGGLSSQAFAAPDVLSRPTSARGRLSPLSSRLPSQASAISTRRTSKLAPGRASPSRTKSAASGGRLSRQMSFESQETGTDGWCPGQSVPGMHVPDVKYDVEMLLLQRVDLLKLKGMRKLLTALQHEECKIETLICIRTEFSDEGARLLSKAMLGKRTCEEGNITPIPGVTLGWQNMKHEDKVHDGRRDLGIRQMVLQQCGIGEKGAVHFAEALLCNQTLALLDLSENRIGKWGVQALAKALVTASKLDYLGLHGNGVDADAIRWLQEAIELRWSVLRQALHEEALRQTLQESLAPAPTAEAADDQLGKPKPETASTAAVAGARTCPTAPLASPAQEHGSAGVDSRTEQARSAGAVAEGAGAEEKVVVRQRCRWCCVRWSRRTRRRQSVRTSSGRIPA
jgi:hypothetical protein